MSTLKFWNKQNSNNNNAANQNGGGSVVENGKTGSGGRNWLHQPDALTNGHVAYLVKVIFFYSPSNLSTINHLLLTVFREYSGGPTQRHRSCQGGHSKVAIHTTD